MPRELQTCFINYHETDTMGLFKPIKEFTYCSSLVVTIDEIKECIELKSIDMIDETVAALREIEHNNTATLYQKVDFIYVFKGQRNILKLKCHQTTKPSSGYSMYVVLKPRGAEPPLVAATNNHSFWNYFVRGAFLLWLFHYVRWNVNFN